MEKKTDINHTFEYIIHRKLKLWDLSGNCGVSRDQRGVEEVEIKCVNDIIGERGGGEMEPRTCAVIETLFQNHDSTELLAKLSQEGFRL